MMETLDRFIPDDPESSNLPEHRRHVWAEGYAFAAEDSADEGLCDVFRL